MPKHHHHHHHHYYDKRQKNGYAYHAGEPGPGPNYYRLRRSMNDRKLAGVCGGLAAHYGWDVGWLRAGLVILTIFFFPLPLLGYIAAAIIIKPGDKIVSAYESQDDERFWRTFSTKPTATFSELKHRFRALDARISDMENMVTSDEYGLRKAFSDLERGK